jgi:hypothetical protein
MVDLFAEKIQKVELKECFPDYKGASNEKEAALFIQVITTLHIICSPSPPHYAMLMCV